MTQEKAETGRFETLLSKIGTGLDDFQRFEHPDALRTKSRWMTALDTPLPMQGIGIDKVLQKLLDDVIPNGSPVARPGFTAYITTGATTVSTLATTAASIASPQRYLLTAFNFLEELSLKWLAEMCGIGQMQGIYSSGGSVANLIALGAARQAAFEQLGHDAAAHGVNREVKVYASHESHNTIQRSGGVLGIGRRAIRPIACDSLGRMQIDKLKIAIEEDRKAGFLPMAIVANAGTTNTGAIDPLYAIAQIARENNIWYHIDGAYGLPGILDERIRHLYSGLELADSVIVDPHKWLGTSVGIAATFVNDRQILKRAFTQEPADYLEGSIEMSASESVRIEHSMDDFGIRYFEYGVELSAPCRGVAVWAIIREIGVDGLRDRVRRHNDMAKNLAHIANSHPNLEVLSEPVLSICCFRFVSPEIENLDQLNQRLHRRLVRENKYMPSTTRIEGKLALRPCFIGALAEHGQVDGLIEAVLRIGSSLVQESQST